MQRPGGPGYALTLRTATYVWWKPLLGVLVLLFGAMVAAPLVLSPILALTVALDHEGSFATAFKEASALDRITWQSMLHMNLVLAMLILIACLLVRYLHGIAPRFLNSVLGSFRWRFFGVCLGLALVAIAAQLLVASLLPGDIDGIGGDLNRWSASTVAIAVVVVLTTPLQAIGEEYGFRGYLLQAFGALAARPWVGIVVSSLIFALAHGDQNPPLFLDRLTFGLLAGYIVVRTGGLEAGIAMHVLNNLFAFGLALAFDDISKSLAVASVPWWNIVVTITQHGTYLVLVLLAARRMGVQSAREEGAAPASGAPVLVPGTPSV